MQATPAGPSSDEAKRRLRRGNSLAPPAARISAAGPVANAAPVVAPAAPFDVSGVALAAALPIFNPDHGHTTGGVGIPDQLLAPTPVHTLKPEGAWIVG